MSSADQSIKCSLSHSNTGQISRPKNGHRFFADGISRGLRSLFTALRSNVRGNTAVMFALAIVPVFGIVGASVDFTNAIRLKTKMATVIDSAALAAASAIDLTTDEKVELVQTFIDTHFDSSELGTLATPQVTASDKTISITLNGNVGTTMLSIFGINSIDVTAMNEVRLKDSKLELALVLDTTGSMSGSKIATLKSSVNSLVDTLFAKENAEDFIRVGIVPFAEFVRVESDDYEDANWLNLDDDDQTFACHYYEEFGYWWYYWSCENSKSNPGAWQGCVRPRNDPNHVNDADAVTQEQILGLYGNCGVQELMPLTNNETNLESKVNSLSTGGNTYIPGGLAWGWRILSPNEPFTDVATYEDEDWSKALVLMTDGSNTINFSYTGDNADAQTSELCENIKASGITVYTVAFQITSQSTKTMVENCATSSSHYYDANDNEALESAFESITEQLSKLRLSK